MREATVIGFKFNNGEETSVSPDGTPYAKVNRYAFGGFYVTSEFNGDTITFSSKSPLGSDEVKLTKIAATGWNYFTADELVQISSSISIAVSTNVAVSADSYIFLELKS
jgi:hypothetical protein